MELVPVQSSQITAVGFDGESTMHVLFRRGGLYEYSNVTVHEYNDVLTSKSVGKAFAAVIKGAKPFRRIEQREPHPLNGEQPQLASTAQPTPELVQSADTATPDPKVQQVSKKSNELVTQAQAIEVRDAAAQAQAAELLLAVAAMRKEIADTWKPMKDAAFKAHRTICSQETLLDAPLLEAEKLLKQRIGAFVSEQQRIAREAEEVERRRLREEADRVAAAESQRLAIEDAVALEADGRHEDAEAVLNNPIPVAPVCVAPAPVVPEIARTKGVSTREVWKFRIVDETKIPREYLEVNEMAIRAVVTRTNGKIKIPGIETYPDTQVAASRRA